MNVGAQLFFIDGKKHFSEQQVEKNGCHFVTGLDHKNTQWGQPRTTAKLQDMFPIQVFIIT